EYEKITNIQINGIDAELRLLGEDYTLFWYDGYRFISILSNITEDQIIKIAKNIKKFK
ncbi:MAG: DUF4367 domain-containing protein, partial [Clostridia bacterium]|nr:DUF4367 domain-containing protein [Clostridia bacterium]